MVTTETVQLSFGPFEVPTNLYGQARTDFICNVERRVRKLNEGPNRWIARAAADRLDRQARAAAAARGIENLKANGGRHHNEFS